MHTWSHTPYMLGSLYRRVYQEGEVSLLVNIYILQPILIVMTNFSEPCGRVILNIIYKIKRSS